jgi:hypothetical protein
MPCGLGKVGMLSYAVGVVNIGVTDGFKSGGRQASRTQFLFPDNKNGISCS